MLGAYQLIFDPHEGDGIEVLLNGGQHRIGRIVEICDDSTINYSAAVNGKRGSYWCNFGQVLEVFEVCQICDRDIDNCECRNREEKKEVSETLSDFERNSGANYGAHI